MMKAYFYHTQNLNYIQSEWEAGRFPSHLLYGASQLGKNGIDVIMHRFTRADKPRWWRMLDVARKMLFCKERYDAIYATKYNGMEIIIFLHALGLFRKPIILWHHQAVPLSCNRWKNMLSRLFYRGIDKMFFFSNELMEKSLATGKVTPSQVMQCPWGCDLDFYDRLMAATPSEHGVFISTGKEQRDMPTLINAFAKNSNQRLELIAPVECCGTNYEQLFSVSNIPDNVNVTINRTLWIPGLAKLIWQAKCVCICCKETDYTVGLTTLVEALAFGLPVIVSKNPHQPFDASEAGCGISVEYGDTQGWDDAIKYISEHPQAAEAMGRRGRQLADTEYNIENCAQIVSETIRDVVNNKNK